MNTLPHPNVCLCTYNAVFPRRNGWNVKNMGDKKASWISKKEPHPEFFWTQNYLDLHYFWTHNMFGQTISFVRTQNFGPKTISDIKYFFDPPKIVCFSEKSRIYRVWLYSAQLVLIHYWCIHILEIRKQWLIIKSLDYSPNLTLPSKTISSRGKLAHFRQQTSIQIHTNLRTINLQHKKF